MKTITSGGVWPTANTLLKLAHIMFSQSITCHKTNKQKDTKDKGGKWGVNGKKRGKFLCADLPLTYSKQPLINADTHGGVSVFTVFTTFHKWCYNSTPTEINRILCGRLSMWKPVKKFLKRSWKKAQTSRAERVWRGRDTDTDNDTCTHINVLNYCLPPEVIHTEMGGLTLNIQLQR